MNSLNILSSRVSSSSRRPRSHSQSDSQREIPPGDFSKYRSYSENNFRAFNTETGDGSASHEDEDQHQEDDAHESFDDKTIFLNKDGTLVTQGPWRLITRRIFAAITETIRFILSTLAAPGVFVARLFQTDEGYYSFFAPIRKISRSSADTKTRPDKAPTRVTGRRRSGSTRKLKRHASRDSHLSTTSESDTDPRIINVPKTRPSHSQDANPDTVPDDSTPRRSIRIKLHHEESLKQQRQRRSHGADQGVPMPEGVTRIQAAINLDSIKSPTSPSSVHRITRYPHSPTPPRPLLPPRLPSYTAAPRNAKLPQKTLVLDLDETLIHSLSKGGRMSSGHMVEVKLSMPIATASGQQNTIGPQHPILYYVHKRPHCDEFLRKICKWYKLVVFTASVQEYADPVIDWLEQERKYFHARYYRQHCTYRNGAFIKDLSSVEPDLSKVMILDNSPLSYIFHEDNSIPIEAWLNDPTDNGLLQLVPMLEALQYVTDVRAFLGLRLGETQH